MFSLSFIMSNINIKHAFKKSFNKQMPGSNLKSKFTRRGMYT